MIMNILSFSCTCSSHQIQHPSTIAEQFERVYKAYDSFLLTLKTALEKLPPEKHEYFLGLVSSIQEMTGDDLIELQRQLNKQ